MTDGQKTCTGGGEGNVSAAFPEAGAAETTEEKRFFTYILRCADGTYYTGWTTDLAKRMEAHNRGTAAKYTRTRRPVKMVYWQEADSREEAMSREWHWKRLRRPEKEEMIAAGVRETGEP